MKRLLTLALACLLLCGCGRTSISQDFTVAEPTLPASTEVSVPEQWGALQVYPLQQRKVQGMLAWGERLLLLSGYGSTTLTLLEGEMLVPAASTVLTFELEPRDPSLRICEEGLSFFDPIAGETLVLDQSLQVLRQIAAPGDLVGKPILSHDGRTLFYCTASDVRAWDLDTGIRRCVKEMAFDSQSLVNVLMEGTVLQCLVSDGNRQRTVFFSGENGQQLWEGPSGLTVSTLDTQYFASIPTGFLHSLVFGTGDSEPQTLVPRNISADGFFLPRQNALVAASSLGDSQVQLEYYDLNTGLCRSTLALTGYSYPKAVDTLDDLFVYVLAYDPAEDRNVVYRWDIRQSGEHSPQDNTSHSSPYHTAASPDLAGLAACQSLARRIGEAHGIEVLIWEDAVAAEPWDYDLEAEHLVPVLQRELALLEDRLSHYPEGFLADTASHFTGLKICLVRSITGTAESGSLNLATGLQFLEGTDAYVAIAVGGFSEQALYHELFHVIETRIYSESQAFDHWDDLNPAGFRYDYDYSANASRDSGVYLIQDQRAFIDTYSMSFPKEDRARIMEYAMLSGNETLFHSEIMQKKLKTLCGGLRDAYGLEEYEQPLLWEQYLE
nr:hypothetical protein [Oscillospiraceae bacterium]